MPAVALSAAPWAVRARRRAKVRAARVPPPRSRRRRRRSPPATPNWKRWKARARRNTRKTAPSCRTKSPPKARPCPKTTRSPAAAAPARRSNERGHRMSDDLRQRRDRLADRLAELQWDLGGLAYEMAIRDHFRLDVLVRRAAELQQVDSELAEVERMLRLDDASAAGACGQCGALYARGAVFCWQCGKDLMERTEVGTPGAAPPA